MTQQLTAAQKRELRELEAKATPGPWEREEEYDYESEEVVLDKALHGPKYVKEGYGANYEVSDTVCVFGFSSHKRHLDNIAFVRASRTALPALLDENEALEATVRRLEGELAEVQKQNDGLSLRIKQLQDEDQGTRYGGTQC